MNQAEIVTFKRRVSDLLAHYEHAFRQIEQDRSRLLQVPLESLTGQGRDIALEAHARAYILDPVLRELGWDITETAVLVVEDTVGSGDNVDEHRRRLDYHGRDNANARSLLVVEAKRPSVKLPASARGSVATVIAEMLRGINTGEDASGRLSGPWREFLETIIDYVKRIASMYGIPPTRFVISNGEWFVIFSELTATLLAQDPAVEKIEVFADLEEVVSRAHTFCELLGYRNLSGHIPAQHPSDLPNFVPQGQEVVCARFVDVEYIRHGERQPIISVSVGVWLRTPMGAWILFKKEYGKQFLILSDDREELSRRSAELNTRAEDLLNDLRSTRMVRFGTREELEEALKEGHHVGEITDGKSALMRKIGPDLYRIVTIDQILYFTDDDSHDKCPYHDWGTCRGEGNAIGHSAITAPSSDPRCFFPSGSTFHCAHAAVQARRKHVCLLLPFEERLCCQRCVHLQHCWPNQDAMPCRTH